MSPQNGGCQLSKPRENLMGYVPSLVCKTQQGQLQEVQEEKGR